jgi:hypothetical protein
MKPILASVIAAGCLAAAAVAGAGSSSAAADHTLSQRRAEAVSDARANAAAYAGVGNAQGLTVRDTVLDKDGDSHIRFVRTWHGLEVVGGDFVVHPARAARSSPSRA